MTDFSFWLGDYGQDESPRVKVTYSNFDYLDYLPDEEQELPSPRKLPEECPEMIVFDEADYEE